MEKSERFGLRKVYSVCTERTSYLERVRECYCVSEHVVYIIL